MLQTDTDKRTALATQVEILHRSHSKNITDRPHYGPFLLALVCETVDCNCHVEALLQSSLRANSYVSVVGRNF